MNELNAIQRRLKVFEKKLYGINYECHFSFNKIYDGTDTIVARELMNQQYNLSWQKDLDLAPIEYKAFVSDFSDKLLFRGDSSAGVQLTKSQEIVFKTELKEFQNLLQQKFKPSRSLIYVHPELRTYIFWFFCFIIISKERNSIYLFEGLASD